jgi:hypothetical protein
MSRSIRRTPLVLRSTPLYGKRVLSTEIPIADHDKFDQLALARNTTKSGLARDILLRIIERPDLLVAVLPEPRP